MLRIGFSGTGGVGKTTVLTALMDKYPHLRKPISSARYVFESKGITESHQKYMTDEALLDLQEEITGHWLKQFSDINEDSIWDRTLLDHYAYGMVRNHKYVDKNWIAKREQSVRFNLESYTHFFFFPQSKTWEPKPDSLRDPSPGTRKLVDLTMQGYLTNYSGTVYYVPTDESPEKVVEFVLNIISQ